MTAAGEEQAGPGAGQLAGVWKLRPGRQRISLEQLQVLLCNTQPLLLGIIPVSQLGIVGGVGSLVQVRDKGLTRL